MEKTKFTFHPLAPKLRDGKKLKTSDGIERSIEHYFIPSLFILFHLIPSIQT
jgi:hypothetical protein